MTLFSAPNYCNEFDNAGAMMNVDENLMCSFMVLKALSSNGKFGRGRSMLSPATPPHKVNGARE